LSVMPLILVSWQAESRSAGEPFRAWLDFRCVT